VVRVQILAAFLGRQCASNVRTRQLQQLIVVQGIESHHTIIASCGQVLSIRAESNRLDPGGMSKDEQFAARVQVPHSYSAIPTSCSQALAVLVKGYGWNCHAVTYEFEILSSYQVENFDRAVQC